MKKCPRCDVFMAAHLKGLAPNMWYCPCCDTLYTFSALSENVIIKQIKNPRKEVLYP